MQSFSGMWKRWCFSWLHHSINRMREKPRRWNWGKENRKSNTWNSLMYIQIEIFRFLSSLSPFMWFSFFSCYFRWTNGRFSILMSHKSVEHFGWFYRCLSVSLTLFSLSNRPTHSYSIEYTLTANSTLCSELEFYKKKSIHIACWYCIHFQESIVLLRRCKCTEWLLLDAV